MKRKLSALLLLFVFTNFVYAQETNTNERFIQVTGSAKKEVQPDEIRFQISIKEYWKEEYEKRKKYKDYVTKIPLKEIENNLMISLEEIGIKKKQIIIKDVGDYWSGSGKDFSKSKTIELVLTDSKMISKILGNVNVKGVNSMRISELKNKNITKYREEVKIEAMRAAKRKANYLLGSIDEKLGRVISVIELDNDINYRWKPENIALNTIMSSDSNNDSAIRKINLSYRVQIRFKIQEQ